MANEKRLISYDVLIAHLDSCIEQGKGLFKSVCVAIKCFVEQMPTDEAVEVVHGRWEKAHIAGYLKCNCCKDAFIYEEWLESGKWSYCPNCGAKMDGEGNG